MEMKDCTWEMFDKAIEEMAEFVRQTEKYKGTKFKNIYGMPRGGLVVAVALSHRLDLPIVMRIPDNLLNMTYTLIVDDICDSGYTLRPYREHTIATIYYRKNKVYTPDFSCYDAKKFFIKFPWETVESSRVDYLGERP